jgi:hypothetical protein
LKMKGLILSTLACAAFTLVGCSSSSSLSSGSSTGVAACDQYLAKVEKCMNSSNMPEAARNAYKQSLSEQSLAAWKQAASTPEGKAMMEKQCATLLETAKTALDNCR